MHVCVFVCVHVHVHGSADKARYQQTCCDLGPDKRPFVGLVVVGAKVNASREKVSGLQVGAEEILWVEHLWLTWLQAEWGRQPREGEREGREGMGQALPGAFTSY